VIAAVAFIVATVGGYSLMAYVASRRTRELGVRMALGATRGRITWLTVGQAMRIALPGAAGGILLATAAGRLLETALFGVVSADAVLAVGVAVLFAGVAGAAGYLPARRAANVDPLVALRVE
jgi:ABC-type antimicrobial peptide transport system permease subunit